MAVRTSNPKDVTPPKPTYSRIGCVTLAPTSELVFITGQMGIDFQTGVAVKTFAEQVEVALANLDKCLVAAGVTKNDIIKVTQYIVGYDPTDRKRGELYLKYMGSHRPPSTVVGVACLAEPDLLYEIEATAVTARIDVS